MKTLKKGKEYKRVFDVVAESMVKNQGWEYCPKHEWKEKVRDAKPKKAEKKKSKKTKPKKAKSKRSGGS